MRRILIISLALLVASLLSTSLYGQEGLLKGVVRGEDNKSIADGYSVNVLRVESNALVKSDFFVDSVFSIAIPTPCVISIIAEGYKEYRQTINAIPNAPLQITLSALEVEIEAVQVQAARRMMKQTARGLEVNVSDSPLFSESGSLLDMLSKIARVLVKDNSIEVIGAGKALIVVDDRPVGFAELSQYSSSEVSTVEVITSPGVKYPTAAAVIEIKTKKARFKGYGGSVSLGLGMGHYFRGWLNATANVKNEWMNAVVYLGASPKKAFNESTYDLNYKETPLKGQNVIQENLTVNAWHDYTGRVSLEITPPKVKGLSIGFITRGNYYAPNDSAHRESTITYINSKPQNLSARVQHNWRNSWSNTNSFYVKYWSKDFYFRANYDLYLNGQKSLQRFLDAKTNARKTYTSNPHGRSHYMTLYGEYKRIPWKHWLAAGMDWSMYWNVTKSVLHTKTSTSANRFEYIENDLAFYTSLNRTDSVFSYTLGIRVEGAIFNQSDVQLERLKKWSWGYYPHFSISYSFLPQWAVSLSGSRRIVRPSISELNPERIYIDDYSYIKGNPELTPQVDWNTAFKITFMQYASLGFSYTRKQNMMAWFVEEDPYLPFASIVSMKNIKSNDVWTLDAVLPYQNSWFTGYLATGMQHTSMDAQNEEGVVAAKKPMFYLGAGLTFTLPYQISIETNLMYHTTGLTNVFFFGPQFNQDLSIRKSFLNGKLTVGLSGYDLWNMMKMTTYTSFGQRHFTYTWSRDSRRFYVTLRWRFFQRVKENYSNSSLDASSRLDFDRKF